MLVMLRNILNLASYFFLVDYFLKVFHNLQNFLLLFGSSLVFNYFIHNPLDPYLNADHINSP